MKARVLAGCAAAFVAALVAVFAADSGTAKRSGVRIDLDRQLPPPAKPAAPPSPANPPVPRSAPDGKAAPPPTPTPNPPAEPEMLGQIVARENGTFLGIRIEDQVFKIRFYDTEKKPMTPDVSRIALRWPVNYQPNPERAVLLPADENLMTSDRIVRAPHSFRLYVTLLSDTAAGADLTAESYVVEFRQ